MRREVRVLSERTVLTVTTDRSRLRPWGVHGDGGNSSCTILHADGQRERLAYSKMTQSLRPCDLVTICTPGAGGWDSPWTRDPASVLWDVKEGFISSECAAEAYGVAMLRDPEGEWAVAPDATRARRETHLRTGGLAAS